MIDITFFASLKFAHHYVSLLQSEEVIAFIIFAIPIAADCENIRLVLGLFLKKKELEFFGKWEEARREWLDTFEYARYGFRSAGKIRR